MIKKLALSLFLAGACSMYAAAPAADNASNSPYQPGNTWSAGSNGGTGFGPWSFTQSGNGGRFIGATGQGSDPSFGLFAGGATGTDQSSASRSFTGGALVVNDKFTLSLGATTVSSTNPGVVGLNLLDGSNPVFTFKFTGGGSFWQLNDGATDFNTNIPFSPNTPILFAFTYNGGFSYTVLITEGATSFVGNNFTSNANISNITGFKLFSNSQGAGQNLGFNNLSVVPEPSSLSLIAGPAILGAYFFVRRRRSA